MQFKYNYIVRVSERDFFMTNYSNAISQMMLDTNLNEPTCQLLLHVYGFSYFKKEGIVRSSQYGNLEAKLRELVEGGYIRLVQKGVEGVTQAVYCVSTEGMKHCLNFYQTIK